MGTRETVAVVGLGYVGLPVAIGFAKAFPTIGYDIDGMRIAALRHGVDRTGEVEGAAISGSGIRFTDDPEALRDAGFFIVTVPTPITADRRPDFGPLLSACAMLGPRLARGDVVVFESTVYPGATEGVCGPALAAASGLVAGRDFALGYSPERINPGDRQHRFDSITKVVSGQDGATLERVAAAYAAVVPAGIHRAPSIAVAEAAKVIENTQRDLNIALMNELSMIFDRLGLSTPEVLAAARTKWNFLPFTPGLVGGHCIGVDPYYLTSRAEEVGYYPQVILAGRRINDAMGGIVADKVARLLVAADRPVKGARVGILGLTFKENVPDIRNSKVPDIAEALRAWGIEPLVHDPLADSDEVARIYGLTLSPLEAFTGLDALIVAVAHEVYREMAPGGLVERVVANGIVADVKGILDRRMVEPTRRYWSL